jgi:hypothetical protein
MSEYKIITIDSFLASYDYIEMTDDDGKVWSIPIDNSNSMYLQYLQFLEETAQ